jgi:N-acetyl-beta-hexosaminidase|eukprot:CAMPEP_0177768850 /NCGR_PEP_ID=MMETSP0491_2-20121128/9966_1 /TAXON_ID=63592 /ORGANISM="Tetraselmis chuii, Strain PLY429" /LENGTH=126 /DNA_ID=CAMNT_0019285735 /DNA_START=253 /DNA_END=633 /DNA_ORIENTATION=-
MLPIENVYDFDPIPDLRPSGAGDACMNGANGFDETLSDEEQAHVLGGQANVWTEYISDEATVEYMLLLRLCALAEAVWTPKDRKCWDDFRLRLRDHVKHLDRMGVRYRGLEEESDSADAMSGESGP